MTSSLARYTGTLADDVVVYPGHGPGHEHRGREADEPIRARPGTPDPSMIGERAISSSAISVVGLSAWLGAAVLAATVVAPAAFAVLPTRSLAGALVGRVLPVLFYGGAVVGCRRGVARPSRTASARASSPARSWSRPAWLHN
jgi:hypothetical protein